MSEHREGFPVYDRGERIDVVPTAVFDSYWTFLAERQRTYFRRLRGDLILTRDPIIERHRFTNAYRAADRVSQYLIRYVIAGSDGSPRDTFYRVLLFKLFNKIETWEALEAVLGPLHEDDFIVDELDYVLNERIKSDETIYSAAYVMPQAYPGPRHKHTTHLTLLKTMLNEGVSSLWSGSESLGSVYRMLLDIPSFGPFLAFQYAIDLGYSSIIPHSETDFVVAGPGARDGIAKCFGPTAASPEAIIYAVTERQEREFEARGIDFPSLWGRRLSPIDVQNGFCEISKYARVAHPDVAGSSGRTRIKQTYRRAARALDPPVFPAHWKLDTSVMPAVSSPLD